MYNHHVTTRPDLPSVVMGSKEGVKSATMNSEAFLKRKRVEPHERHGVCIASREVCVLFFEWRFFKSYFTDPKVRKEQERKRKALKKDVDDVDEEEAHSGT